MTQTTTHKKQFLIARVKALRQGGIPLLLLTDSFSAPAGLVLQVGVCLAFGLQAGVHISLLSALMFIFGQRTVDCSVGAWCSVLKNRSNAS